MFDWLEMVAAEKKLILNPADVAIDETLPSPPISSNIPTLFGTPPTDKEIKEALPLRTAARQTVLDALTNLQTREKDEKKGIADNWDSASTERQKFLQTVLDKYKLQEYKDLINYLKTELVWWNTNIKLTPTTVNTRAVNFKENLQTNLDIFYKASQQSIERKAQKQSSETKEEKKKNEAILNRGITDDIRDSLIISLQYIGIIIYIVVALRFASFAANANLYKPLPYRFLAFIYTFIFAPIVAPYYIWREIKAFFWASIEPPLYESFFPIIPYNPLEELTLNRRLYGYADTEGLQSWIKRQLDKDLAAKEKAISKDILPDVIEERMAKGMS